MGCFVISALLENALLQVALCENKKLNRNACNAMRSLLWNNLHFSMGAIFWKRIFTLMKEQNKDLTT